MQQKEELQARVRGGGIDTPDGYVYELTGGELCLDFANTLDSRPTEMPHELLSSYDDLLCWGVQAGALERPQAKQLERRADGRRRREKALERAHSLREAIFELFAAAARGEAPHPTALDRLNEGLREALPHRRLERSGSAYQWVWDETESLDRVLWPAAVSAAELLTSDRLDRVRVCAAESCDWLFLDQSRNRSRRWCDMTVCGNRAKVRRFRDNLRDTREG